MSRCRKRHSPNCPEEQLIQTCRPLLPLRMLVNNNRRQTHEITELTNRDILVISMAQDPLALKKGDQQSFPL
jgi:hypothetical protein